MSADNYRYTPPPVKCAEGGCPQEIKNNAWAKTKAHAAGWFFQREGAAYCPDHTPEWVEEWRKKKAKNA